LKKSVLEGVAARGARALKDNVDGSQLVEFALELAF
jgi:hypothetical protein